MQRSEFSFIWLLEICDDSDSNLKRTAYMRITHGKGNSREILITYVVLIIYFFFSVAAK